jgi:hypothetical protein
MVSIINPKRWKRQPSGLVTLDPGHPWGRSAEFVYVGGVDHEIVSKQPVIPKSAETSPVQLPQVYSHIDKSGQPALVGHFRDMAGGAATSTYYDIGPVRNALNLAASPTTWAVHAVRINSNPLSQAFAERDQDNKGWGFGCITGSSYDGLGLYVSSVENHGVALSTAVTTQNVPYSFIATYPGGTSATYTDTKFWFNGKSVGIAPDSYGGTNGTFNDGAGSLYIGRVKTWNNRCHRGYLYIVAAFKGLWSDGEAKAWDENPWQFFQHPSASSKAFVSSLSEDTTVESGYSGNYGILSTLEFSLTQQVYQIWNVLERSLSATYSILIPVDKTASYSYSVRNAVDSTLSESYTLAGYTEKVQAFNYAVIGQVNKLLSESYALRNAVVSSLDADYVIDTLWPAPVSNGYAGFYQVYGQVSNPLFSTYRVIAEIGRSLNSFFAITGSVQSNVLSANFAVRNSVTVARGANYSITRLVNRATTFDYLVYGQVTKVGNYTYSINGNAVTTDLVQNYAIRNVVETKFFALASSAEYIIFDGESVDFGDGTVAYSSEFITFPLRYGNQDIVYGEEEVVYSSYGYATFDVRNLVNCLLSCLYPIKGLVDKVVPFSFDVRNVVERELEANYEVSKLLIASELVCSYSIRKIVEAGRTFSYNVKQVADSLLAQEYAVRQLVHGECDPEHNICNLVGTSLHAEFDVRNIVSKGYGFGYRIILNAERECTTTYQIRNVVTNTLSCQFTVTAQLYSTCAQSYNIRGIADLVKWFYYKVNAYITDRAYQGTYDIRNTVDAGLSQEYVLTGQVTDDLIGWYDVIGRVESTLNGSYKVDEYNTAAHTFIYDIRGQVYKDLDCIYGIGSTVSRKLLQVYSIRKVRKGEGEFIYDISDGYVRLRRNESYDVPQKIILTDTEHDEFTPI